MKQIPNIFTLLNLFFGCLAVVFILQTGTAISYTTDGLQLGYIPERIWMASLCIGIAGLVDFLDGFIARLFKVTSEMGKQLDSLADVVSFGVAPGMILYQFLLMSFMQDVDALEISIVWLLPAFILPCAAAYRLAKFNLDETQQYGFKGVPTPAVGILIASFPLIYWNSMSDSVVEILLNKWFLYLLIFLLSYLMISNLPLMSLKFKNFGVRDNLPKFILAAVAIASFIFLKWLAIPVIFVLYIVISLIVHRKPT